MCWFCSCLLKMALFVVCHSIHSFAISDTNIPELEKVPSLNVFHFHLNINCIHFIGCAELLYVQILSDRFVVGNAFDDCDVMFGLFRSKEDANAAAEILEITAWDKAEKQTIITNRLKFHELTNLRDGTNKHAAQSIEDFSAIINCPRMLDDWHEVDGQKLTRKLHVEIDKSTSYTALVKDAGEQIQRFFVY